jgi:hypothetical protein
MYPQKRGYPYLGYPYIKVIQYCIRWVNGRRITRYQIWNHQLMGRVRDAIAQNSSLDSSSSTMRLSPVIHVLTHHALTHHSHTILPSLPRHPSLHTPSPFSIPNNRYLPFQESPSEARPEPTPATCGALATPPTSTTHTRARQRLAGNSISKTLSTPSKR